MAIALTSQRNPLDAGSRETVWIPWRTGTSLRDVLPGWATAEGVVAHVYLNGVRARVLDQALLDDDVVEVLEIPQGLLVAPAVGAVLTGTASALAAKAAAVAFWAGAANLAQSFAFSFLVGKLLAPNKGPANPGDEASPTYRFGGIASNGDAEGAALPLVFGQIRTGGVVVQRYTRASLTSTYLYTLVALSEGPIEAIGDVTEDSGPLRLSDGNLPAGMEVNGRPVSDFEEVEVHVRLGDLYQDAVPGFEASSVQYPVDQALPPSSTPGAVTITPKNGGYDPGVPADLTELNKWDTEVTYSMGAGEEADEFSATVTFPEGLYTFSGSGSLTNNQAQFQLRYQALDGSGTPIGKVVVLPAEGTVTQAKTGAFDVEFRHPFIDPATYTAPAQGFYLKLQGVNGCVTKASPTGMTDPQAENVQWTTSGWVKLDVDNQDATQTYHVWNFWDGATNRGFKVWLQYISSGAAKSVRLFVQYGTGSGSVTSDFPVESLAGPFFAVQEWVASEVERWHHLAVTYGGSSAGVAGAGRLKFYWDGALVWSLKVENVNHRLPTAGTVRVGSETNVTNFADADFDVFKLFLRELTGAEVQVQYADGSGFTGTGSEPDLLLCWPFDTSGGGTTDDLSPNNNDGTLVTGAAISVGTDFGVAPGSAGGTFKRGRYKVEIQRLNAESTSTLSRNAAEWTAIQLVTWADFRYPGVALVGIRQKATDQLQGGPPTYTFEVKGRRVPVWNGASTVTPSAPLAWSQNPAWIAAGVLTSEEGLGDRYGLVDLKLDEFKAWADWCDEYVPDGLEEVDAADLTSCTLSYNASLNNVTAVLNGVESVPDKWQVGYAVRFEALNAEYNTPEGAAYVLTSVAYVSDLERLTLVAPLPAGMAAPTTLSVTLTTGKIRGAERRMQCDIVLDRRNDEAVDVLERIFSSGRAQRVVQGGRVGVFVERAASPVALVTHASVVEGSLETLYTAIDERPNVIQAEILDRDAGYTVQRLELEHPDVQDPAKFDGRRVRSISLEGVVRRSQALREIKYQLNLFHLVRRQASWKQPALAIARRPGDVVMVAHDVPQWGYSGKLRGSSATQAIALSNSIERSLWMNVGLIADYTPRCAIYRGNLFTGARFWVSETASGPKNLTDNGQPKSLDQDAIPLSLASGQRLATVLFRDILTTGLDTAPLPVYRAGNYIVTWASGTATPEVGYDASGLTLIGLRKWRFTVTTPSSAGIHFAFTSITSKPEGLRLYYEADEPFIDSDPWAPEFVEFTAPFRGLRWMGAQDTNQNKATAPIPSDYLFWTVQGPPIEKMCEFSNRYGKDLWTCCPALYPFIQQLAFAGRHRSALAPERRWWCEYSNEHWNGGAFEIGGAWYLGPLISSSHVFSTANDFQPHPTISNAFVIGPGAVDPNPFRAMRIQSGILSNNFFASVENAWGTEISRVTKVFGAQYVSADSVLDGVANCPKCDVVAGAPYNPPSPLDPDFNPDTQTVNQLFTNLAGKHAEIEANISNFVTTVSSLSKGVCWYEGGQQIIAQSGGVLTMMAVQSDPRIKDEILWILDKVEQYAPNSVFAFYSDATAGGPEGQFGAKRWYAQPNNQAFKYQALLEWIGDTDPDPGGGGGGGGGGPGSGEADYTVFLDRDVVIPSGTVYMVIEDQSTNEHAQFTIQSAAGTYVAGDGIAIRGTDDWVPAKGDQYSLGSTGKIYKRFRVVRTAIDGDKMQVDVEAVEYNEAIYSDDFGSLPLPETSLTTNTLDSVTPEAVQNLTVTETTATNEDGGAVVSATLNWQYDPETVRSVAKVEIYVQPIGKTPELRLSIPGQPTAAHVQLDQTDRESLLEFFVRPVGARGQARAVRASARGHLRPLGLVITPPAPTSLGLNQTGYRAVYTLVDSGAARVGGYEFRRGGWILGQRIGFTARGETQLGPTFDFGAFSDDAGANGPYPIYARSFLGSGQYGKQVTLSSYPTAPGKILFERHLQDHGATGWNDVTLTGFSRVVSAPGTALVADNITGAVSIDYTFPALREAQEVYVYFCWEATQTYSGAETPVDTPLGNRWTTEGPLWTYSGETENTAVRAGFKYVTTTATPTIPLSSDGYRPGSFYLRRGRIFLRFSRSSASLIGINLKRAYIAVVEAPRPRLNFPNVEAYF